MTNIKADTTVSLTDDQVSADVSGEVVVLHLSDGVYFQLNEVGARIWQLIGEQPRQVSELIQAITDEYAVDQSRCEADVMTLLRSMSEKGLIHTTASAD